MVATMLLGVVLGVLGSALVSLTNSSAQGEALVANQQDVLVTLTQLGRDLRAANPLLALPTTSAYTTSVEMTDVNPSGGTGTTVEWVFNTSSKTLTRELLVNGSVTSAKVMLKGVQNSASQPMFSYFDLDNNNLVSEGDPPATISTCTTRVEALIVGLSDPGPSPFQESQDIQLRNQIANLAAQGNNPC